MFLPSADKDMSRFIEAIRRMGESPHRDRSLLIASNGALETYYAPFDYINRNARVVIVGLTPGLQQMYIALRTAYEFLAKGYDWHSALKAAKFAASFGGPMRRNLIATLDSVELHRWLGLPSCACLFSNRIDLVHFTSILRYPVFYKGKNYNGVPCVASTPFLLSQARNWFGGEVELLNRCVYILLGGQVLTTARTVCLDRGIRESAILAGFPHPSGANAERIAYFVGRKVRQNLSSQTDADRLDLARSIIVSKVSALGMAT